ncbi:DUF5367 family protein [Oceanobacillus sp. FSL W8-0428]|uniref:DUF5367 family protein n=1 Tax=Oceanobacillus sojae TaxID=582851 RepID=A0A511ZGW8_9BACI|nr:DUF5367 family protein [Oceanobacillus sojae]GEN86685.1 hypothetical protein OSO01_14240 [Oceanobacillus sojae]
MKTYLFTAAWGVIVWIIATLFFRIFGEDVLFTPGTDAFMYSTAILLVGTAILLTLVIYLYTLFDKKDYAAIRFGIVGTMTGLVLDSFVFSNYQMIFPNLDETQIIAFSSWMSFAYALYLVIPFLFQQRSRQKQAVKGK